MTTTRRTPAARKAADLAADVADRREPTGPASDEPFTFEPADGSEPITVPSLAVAEGRPNPLALAEAREAGDTLLVMLLMTRAKAPDAFPRLKRLDPDEFDRFAIEWADHSGVTVGKSPVS